MFLWTRLYQHSPLTFKLIYMTTKGVCQHELLKNMI